MKKLLPFALLSVLGASHAFATPITFEFTGHVTDVNTIKGMTGENFTDPTQPGFIGGVQYINGDTSVSGTYTFDDTLTDWHGYGEKPTTELIYQFTTEGISFGRTPGWGYLDRFSSSDDQVRSQLENALTDDDSLLSWARSMIEFNFVDGEFVGGTFHVSSDVSAAGVTGSIDGIIDHISIATVPEPSPFYLVMAGIAGFGVLRFRKQQREASWENALLS